MSASEVEIDPSSKAALENFLLQFPGGLNSIRAITDRRAALDSVTKKISEFEDSDVEALDLRAPTADKNRNIALRLYGAKKQSGKERKACLIYIHGGGMIMGNLDTGNLNCFEFARRLDVLVISIEYRKSPEFPYPAAINDCVDGINWIAKNADSLNIDTSSIGIYGSSAGGGLVLGTVLKLRDMGQDIIKYMLPIYPMIDDTNTTASSFEITNLGVWDRSTNIEAWNWYLDGTKADEYAAPTRAENLTGLPPCYSDVGNFDLFRDENALFFDRLAKSGVPTEFNVFSGAFHGSENLAPESELSKAIWKKRFSALKQFIEM
jgi:acetyl esterase/lipase